MKMLAMSVVYAAACFCLAIAEDCSSDSAVRLGGLGSREVGMVQVCDGGEWGDVCGPWRESNAAVLCRELGYSSGAVLTTTNRLALSPGNKSSSHMTSHMTCSGLESSLAECPTTQTVDCRGPPPIVMCTNSPVAGTVRLLHLTEGGSEVSGVVEVYTGREWVGVCTDDWSKEDSEVVCQQLGYPNGTPSTTRPHPTVIRRLPLQRLNYFQCSGNEQSLLSCNHTLYSIQCHTAQYASVNCSQHTPYSSNASECQDSCPPVSINLIMGFAAVQLLVVGLSILLNIVILVAWTKWRRGQKVAAATAGNSCPEIAGAAPPPSYSDASRDTLLETGGEATPTLTN